MPQLTLAQIASHATRLANDALIPLSVVSEYANIAYGIVSQAAGILHSPKEQVVFASTTTSDNRLAFPSDYDFALGLKVGIPDSWSTATSRTTRWEGLTKAPAPWNDPYQSQTSGAPRDYAEFATWFELRPSPDSRYSVELRYMRKITELTASTSTPMLDEQWHWALALKTAELIAANGSDGTLEARNRARYASYINDLRVDQGRRRMDPRGMYFTRGTFRR